MDLTLWIELVVFIVLMALSAFFSSSETSLFSLNKMHLQQMQRDDNPSVGLIERLLSEPRRLIVTILIGNEFVNVAASVISAAIVIRVFGADAKLMNLIIMVPILLLVGEITPKTLAIRNNIAFAGVQARPIAFFARLISPLRWLIRMVADWFTTLLVGSQRSKANIITEDIVRTLAHEAVGDGVLNHSEAQYIDHIFDFGNRSVEDLMTPRSKVFFLPLEMPLPEMVEALHRTRRTKVPIYREHRDQVIGILYARDLLGKDLKQVAAKPDKLPRLLRKPYFVPETKPAAELFRDFRARKRSLALTVDEYGGVTGLISMEDLLEAIFGAIPSRSDRPGKPILELLGDGPLRLDGATRIRRLESLVESPHELPHDDDIETVAGLILHELGELPAPGRELSIAGLRLTVTRVGDNRIQEVSVEKPDELPETTATDLPPPDTDNKAPDTVDDSADDMTAHDAGAAPKQPGNES